MEIFISWSGPRSQLAADALGTWLPSVLQALKPWLSSANIDAGSRWYQDLGLRLSSCNFGIICLTPENQTNSWLLYEAGALSKAVEDSKVVPYLIGLRNADVKGPLSHFQAVESDRDGTLELIKSLNATLENSNELALSESSLLRTYEVWWPELSSSLEKAREAVDDSSKKVVLRDTDDMILEIVTNTRNIARRIEALKAPYILPKPIVPFEQTASFKNKNLNDQIKIIQTKIKDLEEDLKTAPSVNIPSIENRKNELESLHKELKKGAKF